MPSTTQVQELELQINAPVSPAYAEILTPEAQRFVASLAAQFDARRKDLLARRQVRQGELDAGHYPDFLTETAEIRTSEWTVAPIPADLMDRRVEITGPVDRKMVINALNCGANVFMADFEDANSPTWTNNLDGQINLRDAIRRTIEFTSPEGKRYKLNDKIATLLVRTRGWHLNEKHVLQDGKPISGSLFDSRIVLLPQRQATIANGSGPYFYLPKLESHLEARLWNDVFNFAQGAFSAPRTIRATVLIETILASFEMDEILYELRDHSAAQLRTLGLHFQLHQEISQSQRVHAAEPRRGHDDTALSQVLRGAADPDLPPARDSRHGRHGGAGADQERSRGQRTGARKSSPGQTARGARRSRWHLGGSSGTGAGGETDFRRRYAGSQSTIGEAR
jgi:malate synthase